jgi:hypothetical protein
MDYQDLLQRARWGKLKSEEVDSVAQEMQKRRPALDRASLLHILGESKDKRHRKLVEKCLYSGDVKLAKMALQTLCVTWGEAAQHTDDLLRFLRGVEWDTEQGGHVILIAISLSGEYLRNGKQRELLTELIDIYEKEGSIFKDEAYVALVRGMGHSWSKALMKGIPADKLLKEAKARLSKEKV